MTPEEHPVAFIPRTFMERVTFMDGMIKIVNAIDFAVLALLIEMPVVLLALPLTKHIVVLWMTSLPAFKDALIVLRRNP